MLAHAKRFLSCLTLHLTSLCYCLHGPFFLSISCFITIRWMNGQHLRALPSEELCKILGDRWKTGGILLESEGMFVKEAAELLKDGIDLVTDADKVLSSLLEYPLNSTLTSVEGKPVLEDKLPEVASSLISAYDSGELQTALEEGHAGWQKWVKSFGKLLKRKGKSLFMPLRVLLTGKLHGPDMGGSILLIYKAGINGAVNPQFGFQTLDDRFRLLKELDWEALRTQSETQPQPQPVASASH